MISIYIGDKESTLPALTAAKQLALNNAYEEVTVTKYITVTKRVVITLTWNSDKGAVTEAWSFEDSSIHVPTVIESPTQQAE